MQFTRSLIEKSIDLTIETCVRYGIHLPPFAYWTVEFWDAHPESVNEIRDCMLGWDVTDFGSSDFTHIGRTLFTLRNGSAQKPATRNPMPRSCF